MFMRCTKTLLAPVLALALLGAACGDDDDAEGAVDAGEDTSADEATDGDETQDGAAADDEQTDDGEGSATSGANGTATLVLANGEEFEFSILCSLEPQMAADQEILFSVTSYDEPYGFDATKFGEDSVVPGMASVDVYDSETYESVWSASSMMGGGVELELDGSTVTGTATFFEGDEGLGDGVEGELTASC
ncbi:hypothetical protein NHL50_14635 [Acidimicrobiia bacterium EGI L10123]|uniref:hypothetical protein n=1 Tax=Salinilacustrithrix flava TaxID=2957203 RepID=UPI003D7C1DA8|nr:hypothetical protein [Acidimicrobiia bacterium EGI L10123]